MTNFIICISLSVLCAWLTTKVMAIRYFREIDGHIREEHDMIKNFTERTERMLEENFCRRE